MLAAQSTRRTYRLEVGAVVEVVEVQSSASLVNTVSAEQQQTVSTRQVTELPLARRNVADVISLNTGVVRAGGDVILNGLGGGAHQHHARWHGCQL